MDQRINIDVDVNMDIPEGFPTFKEFQKNPDKWRTRKDAKFGEVDKGGSSINKITQRHSYEIEGYKCKTLEEVERVALSQGIPIEALDYRPQVIPQSGHKCDLKIVFVPKHIREKRENW